MTKVNSLPLHNTNDYIRRGDAIDAVYERILQIGYENDTLVLSIRQAVRDVAPSDVVSRDAFYRILAENDTMREQLAEIGKKPGDDMSDVRRIREEWIPISDYLPKVREPVIVAIKWDDDGSVDRGVGRYTGRPDYFGNTWRVYEAELGELNKGYQVTHWMPLPSLPEKLE